MQLYGFQNASQQTPPTDLRTFQQVLNHTFKDFTPPRIPSYQQGSQAPSANSRVPQIYFNHWYDDASVIDSILRGGSDYYILATDNLGNFVIDLTIDQSLVERSTTDVGAAQDSTRVIVPEKRVKRVKIPSAMNAYEWDANRENMSRVEVQVINAEHAAPTYNATNLSQKAAFLSPKALQRLFYDVKHGDLQGMIDHLQAIELSMQGIGVVLNLDESLLHGKNLLTHAACCGANEFIRYLVEVKGMDVNFYVKYESVRFINEKLQFAKFLGIERSIIVLLHIKKLELDVSNDDYESFPTLPKYHFRTALHLSVDQGKAETVSLLLQYNANMDAYDEKSSTPFLTACETGYTDIAEGLLKHGQKVITVQDDDINNPLHRAAVGGHIHMMDLLLKHGADIDHVVYGLTPLMDATHAQKKESIKFLLEKGADPDFQNDDGYNALCLAVEQNDIEIVNLLLDNGASVNPTQSWSVSPLTPLERAVKANYISIAKLLIDRGAQVYHDDGEENSSTPLIQAVQAGNIKMVTLFLDLGCDIEHQDENNYNALYYAVMRVNIKMIDLLVKHGANVNARLSDKEHTILMACMQSCDDYEGIKALLDCGADVLTKDKQGRTALHMLCHRMALQERLNILKLLVETDADVNGTDNKGRTVLHYMVTRNLPYSPVDSVRYLLANGADPEIMDIDGRNVFHYAANQGNVDVLSIIQPIMEDAKAVDNYGMNALHFAAWQAHFPAVVHLVNQGFEVDKEDFSGITPIHLTALSSPAFSGYIPDCYVGAIHVVDHLGRAPIHFAMMAKSPNMAMTLLRLGANPAARDKQGNTAAHYAVSHNNQFLLNLLERSGLDIYSANYHRQIPLHIAAINHYRTANDIVDNLFKTWANSSVNSEDDLKRTPLLLACTNGFYLLIDKLIKRGANPKARDINGMNALHYYGFPSGIQITNIYKFERQSIEIFESPRIEYHPKPSKREVMESLALLAMFGSDINAQDKNGDTPLHQAVAHGLYDKVECLLQLGVRRDIKNNSEKTARDIAEDRNHQMMLTIFNNHSGNA